MAKENINRFMKKGNVQSNLNTHNSFIFPILESKIGSTFHFFLANLILANLKVFSTFYFLLSFLFFK